MKMSMRYSGGIVFMILSELQDYIVAASGNEVICVVHSIHTGKEIAASFDIVADINEYGQLTLNIAIET
jgi:hypothetical protein